MTRLLKSGRLLAATVGAVAIATGGIAAVSGSASASVPAADSPGVVAAKKIMSYLSTVPTQIPIKVPLTKRPPTGKKVYYIGVNAATNTQQYNGFAAAATALGWSPTRLSYPANPADAVGLVQQAIQQGANYIAVSGTEPTVLQPALDAARAANVPVFLHATGAVPAGKVNWIFSSVGSTREWVPRGNISAAMTVANSNGKANAVVYNVPQFEIFSVWGNSYVSSFKKLCPSCVLNGVVNIPFSDFASGKGSSSLVAYLRAHPEVNQIACNISLFCADVPTKAQGAGLTMGNSGIGLSTGSALVSTLQQIMDGTVQSSIASPLEYQGWQIVDAMARVSVNNSLTPNWNARVPLYLFTQKNVTPSTQMFAGPTNYTGQFKKLWHRA